METNENTQPKEKVDEKLQNIELGEKYTAKISLDQGFRFELHMPTVQEEMLVYAKMKQIMLGMGIDDIVEEEIKFMVRAIATLDIVISSIESFELENGVKKFSKIGKTFWEWISDFRNPNLAYSEIVMPLYKKYVEFYRSVDVSLDELKKN